MPFQSPFFTLGYLSLVPPKADPDTSRVSCTLLAQLHLGLVILRRLLRAAFDPDLSRSTVTRPFLINGQEALSIASRTLILSLRRHRFKRGNGPAVLDQERLFQPLDFCQIEGDCIAE